MNTTVNKNTTCFHCGDTCSDDKIRLENKTFCCSGCKTVYEILSQNNLGDYYKVESKPGTKMKSNRASRFEYLNQPETVEKLIDFKDDSITKIQFYLPQIHCSACLWLLENLYKLNDSVINSRVNFLKKECYLTFDHNKSSLKDIVELLAAIGYEPKITLDHLDGEQKKSISRKLIYQVGLAGFAFGNIMLLSLPEYFGLDVDSFQNFRPWFAWINLGLATPVAVFSGQDYFKSALKSISQKRLNIDVPIALGVLILFLRSVYEILTETGPGYFDSLCGLLFFLLLGRIFQDKIYHQLSFERDYRSYFPIAVTQLINGKEKDIPINMVNKGDKILIRNGELIPVDAYLIKGKAKIDNSFATGESAPISKNLGEKIFAGGRQVGEAIQLKVIKPLNQSKLTRLWSEYAEQESSKATFSKMTDKISEWFTPIILVVGLISSLFHSPEGIGKAIEIFSAVLIVACPCALALAAPFTFGHATRWLGKQQCFLREASVLEEMAEINHLIFDKTGTLTLPQKEAVSFKGEILTSKEKQAIFSLVNQSTHPLSRIIRASFNEISTAATTSFKELEGKGLEGFVKGEFYRIGSKKWLQKETESAQTTEVYVEKSGVILGCFQIKNLYRKNLKSLIANFSDKYALTVISGDNESEKETLTKFFPATSLLLFNQTPKDKLKIIQELNLKGENTMMIGDGLNDAGALREAKVGVSVAEDINAFSPACDIIISGNQFGKLNQFLQMAKGAKHIVIASFVISFLYNIVGLSFAVQGLLSPVFAAILMPVSSITVVSFVSLAVWMKGRSLHRAPRLRSETDED